MYLKVKGLFFQDTVLQDLQTTVPSSVRHKLQVLQWLELPVGAEGVSIQ